MEQLKQIIMRHFEKILVSIILIAAFVGTYLVEEKFVILNFYYLPVLIAGYFLGRPLKQHLCFNVFVMAFIFQTNLIDPRQLCQPFDHRL
jgi:hypothetical protein